MILYFVLVSQGWFDCSCAYSTIQYTRSDTSPSRSYASYSRRYSLSKLREPDTDMPDIFDTRDATDSKLRAGLTNVLKRLSGPNKASTISLFGTSPRFHMLDQEACRIAALLTGLTELPVPEHALASAT